MQSFLGIAGLLGTVLLLAITAWYAWHTQEMVREMRESRVAAVRPYVCLDIESHASNGLAVITNVGLGPAIDIALVVEAESLQPASDRRLEWTTPLLRVGERRLLDFPWGPTGPYPLQSLRESHARVRLSGTCSDLLGNQLTVDDVLNIDDSTAKTITVSSSDDVSSRLRDIAKELASVRGAVEELSGRG